MIQRITELSEPPIIGLAYLVPTVTHPWHFARKPKPWPVFLPRHNDEQFLNFPDQHFHIDPRFVSQRDYDRADTWYWDRNALATFQASPLASWHNGKVSEPPEPVWRRRTCRRPGIDYQHDRQPSIQRLHAHYAGQFSARNRHGWVCPHQHAPLGSIAPSSNGVIECPLHGLRIRVADGMCLDATP